MTTVEETVKLDYEILPEAEYYQAVEMVMKRFSKSEDLKMNKEQFKLLLG